MHGAGAHALALNVSELDRAIYSFLCSTIVDESKFISNRATPLSGGAIYIFSSTIRIKNSLFDNNYGEVNGGAIYTSQSTMYMIQCNIIKTKGAPLLDGATTTDST